jgi:uncharacterized protein YkwD
MMRILLIWFLMAVPVAADTEILAAVNAERAAKNRAALVWDTRLEAAARKHAEDMVKRGYFSHVTPEGGTFQERVRREGYAACMWAENIAQGQRNVTSVMKSWMGSRGHRRNILHRKARAIGVAQGPDRMWVMVLAAPC